MKINKANHPHNDPNQALKDKLRGAAELYEKQFLREMVKAMRRSVDHSAMTKPGMAEGIYREQLDDQHVEHWVERGGTGFADIVYNEIVDKYFPQLRDQPPRQGLRPVDLTDRFQGVSAMPAPGQPDKNQFLVQLGPEMSGESMLKVPWRAELTKAFQLPSGEQVVQMKHPEGLSSTFVFKGPTPSGQVGQEFEAGEGFARLSPEARSLTWQLDHANSRKGSP